MRGLRSFLGLLTILIALGAYLYFVESKRPPGGDQPAKEKVFAVESDTIEEVSIKAESGERTTVRKAGDAWQIVEPAPGPADAAEVAGLMSSLSSLEVQSIVDENPPDLKEYGLAQPRLEVSFKAGGEQRTLHIGQKTPPGSDLYARRANETRVFLIPSYLDSTFNKKPFDLRDKSVLKVDREKLDTLEVSAAGRTMRFVKADGEWRMTQPAPARADFGAVDSLVGRLSGLQMKSLAAAEAADPKPYGFDTPVATVRLGSGSSLATLVFGGTADAGGVYARDASRPAVFTVEGGLVDELKKEPDEYRQKDLFDARAFNSTRIEIVRAGQTHTLEKTKSKNKDGQDEERWRQTAPQARDVDQAKADALASAITSARAAGFAPAGAKTGLDRPELTIAIKYEEGRKEERVAFARSGGDVYAQRAGDASVARLDAAALDAIVKALEELK
jgi:hypothetical protein